MPSVALTIAGSDPSGGAGLQADLKTFQQFGVYGEAVVTLITVQNTTGCQRVECLAPDLVLAQLQALLDDIPPAAAKTGALGDGGIAYAIARAAADFRFPLVVDPVMVGKHGTLLASADAQSVIARELVPRAFLVTPNLAEAASLTGLEVRDVAGMRRAAVRLREMGARAVLVKGGHLNECDPAVDILLEGGAFREFSAPRLHSRHTHGAGCTFSAAITAGLALGEPLEVAIERAKVFMTEAIRTNPGLGRGNGPVNHHASQTSHEGASS